MAEEIRRCNDCLAKITHVAQEVEKTQRDVVLLQERVTREVEEIHQQREERDAEYIRNMARGEDTFKALFGEMHKLREQLVDIVTTALKDRNIIEQQINEKNIALAREEDLLPVVRRWALAGLGFLTIGIVLGGAWGYDELRWGGYWA